MTSHQDLQSLISEIESVLPKASPRFGWHKSSTGDVAAQRRVLERVRQYLIDLSKRSDCQKTSEIEPNQQSQPTQQILYADLVKEINSLRDSLIKPLQSEIEALHQQRESLLHEIRQIEAQRQYYNSLGQQQAKQQQIISEFLQALMGHLQESLTQQISHTLVDLKTQLISSEMANSDLAGGQLEQTLAAEFPSIYPLPPQERLKLIQQMQSESDHLLISLDATLRTVLETLHQSVFAYQESLSNGVAKMHSLGQQGEMLFTMLINHLGQRVVETAPIDLPSSQIEATPTSTPITEPAPAEVERTAETTNTDNQEDAEDTVLGSSSPQQLPFPGMELPSSIESPQPPVTELEDFHPAIESNELGQSQNTDSNIVENQQSEKWEIIEDLDLGNLEIESSDFDAKDLSNWELEPVDLPETLSEDLILEDVIKINNSEVPRQTPTNPLADATNSTILARPVDANANFNPTEQSNLPIPSLSNTQDQNLSLVTTNAVSAQATETDIAGQTGTDLEPDIASKLQEQTSSEPETITALTDLFDDLFLNKEQMLLLGMGQELDNNGEESSFGAVSTQYIPQLDLESYPDVEDSYIPASPDEHLFVKDESDRQLDINLWFDENTIQQLGRDLFSFESLQEPNAPLQQPQGEQENNWQFQQADNGTKEIFNVEPWRLLTSNELLGEDWQDFEVEGFVDENYSPHSANNSTPIRSNSTENHASAYDVTQLPSKSTRDDLLEATLQIETTTSISVNLSGNFPLQAEGAEAAKGAEDAEGAENRLFTRHPKPDT